MEFTSHWSVLTQLFSILSLLTDVKGALPPSRVYITCWQPVASYKQLTFLCAAASAKHSLAVGQGSLRNSVWFTRLEVNVMVLLAKVVRAPVDCWSYRAIYHHLRLSFCCFQLSKECLNTEHSWGHFSLVRVYKQLFLNLLHNGTGSQSGKTSCCLRYVAVPLYNQFICSANQP